MKLVTDFNIPPYLDVLQYHCVWFGDLHDHHILCLASLFATQQNPSVTLWTDEESYSKLAPLLRIFSSYQFAIRIGKFKENTSYQLVIFRADKWRLQILKQYGGVYFDLDIVFFKDVSWFANYGPIVQEGFASEKIFNNAIMYYPRQHPGIEYWLSKIGDNTFDWGTVFSVQKMSDDTFGASMLPNSVSDRAWHETNPEFDLFFEPNGMTHEYMGDSFLYHWHNRWSKSVHVPNTLVNFYWNKYVTSNLNLRISTERSERQP